MPTPPRSQGDEDEEGEKKIYKYEGARLAGAVVDITETAGEDDKAVSKTEPTTLLGARSGQGTATHANNDVYEGAYGADGKGVRHGQGKYTYAAPPPAEEDAGEEPPKPVAVYEGGWLGGHKSGIGTMT